MLRSVSGPMLLTKLAEDLAPADTMQVSNEELPPGVLDCRNRLEAFRNAAVEAISMEALMSIHNKKHPVQVENIQSKEDRQSKPRGSMEGPPPGVQECKQNLGVFMAEVAKAKMMQAETSMIRG